MEDGAFNTTFMTGAEYAKWVEGAESTHRVADEGSRLPRHAVMFAQRPARMPPGAALSRRRAACVAGLAFRLQRDSMSDQDTAGPQGRHFDAHDGDRRSRWSSSPSAPSSCSTATGSARGGATTVRNRAISRSTSGCCSASRVSRRWRGPSSRSVPASLPAARLRHRCACSSSWEALQARAVGAPPRARVRAGSAAHRHLRRVGGLHHGLHALARTLSVGEERGDRSRRQRHRSSSCSRSGSRFRCTRAPSIRSSWLGY